MKKITITPQTIQHIAHLSNLEIPKGELKSYAQSLGSIFGYFERIVGLKLQKVPITARVTEEENVLREDKVGVSFTQKAALAGTSKTYKGYFVVDHILKKKDT